MVPKIMPKGSSFKGAAMYYLHDKGSETNERVEWTETVNIGSDSPEVAWRVMVATAQSQQMLKEQAGIPNTGRKSDASVMTYSLSWHPDEKAQLTKDEMLRAAHESLEVLGATKHQALIVCHNDEPHPHVHIMINRISPIDGRMLSSSNEKILMSRWAQKYEERRGSVYCHERVANNHARDVAREYVRGSKDTPRHIFEIERAANENGKVDPKKEKVLKAQERRKDAALSKQGRDMHDRHKKEWTLLSVQHQTRKADIEAATKEAVNKSAHTIRDRDMKAWRGLFKRHADEMKKFHEREAGIGGRLQNAAKAIISSAAVRGERSAKRVVGQSFKLVTSKASRLDQLKKMQEREIRRFKLAQKREINSERRAIRRDEKSLKEKNLERFYGERSQIKLTQNMDNAKLRSQWSQRNKQRRQNWSKSKASVELRRDAKAAFQAKRPSRGGRRR